ncbi:hypothetical protein F5X68DRAFT_137138 [Plectosphaerella plurivora]|uniref:Amine oxidase domain-containing protein n=1 Tax=Plectosphaerella plurivora TaxID=936078 RepID=A0A9P8V8M1_9PEZI|nr:hypothetical protein F5X68DRAFT_137138 [Plectosphaerella plurivora]
MRQPDSPSPTQSEPVGDEPRKTKVAIVGTGLAGLTTAFLLQQDPRQRYAVTVFEQADTLAFDGASVAVKNERTGQVERIDLPMRASAGGYYANLNRMYEYLEVPIHPIRFMFVFAKALSTSSQQRTPPPPLDTATSSTYFVHASNLHQMPPPWPSTRGVVAHVFEIFYLIICQFWFSIACFLVPPRNDAVSGGESVAEYLERLWLPRRYISHYLLPLMSSVSTCTHEQFLAFPASDLVNYKKLSHGQKHYAVCGGVSQVQSRLAGGLEDVRLQSRVLEVSPTGSSTGVAVRWMSAPSSAPGSVTEERFDRVVLAVSPDVAGRIFRPLAHTLGKIPTLQVESSVHRPRSQGQRVDEYTAVDCPDTLASCMHHGRDASRAQTITLRTLFADKASRSEAAHIMPSGVVVSTCPLEEGDSKSTLQTARFTRTLRTTQSRALVERIMGRAKPATKKHDSQTQEWVSGEAGVWLAGAWCWDGMVLLEGCVVSAMQIARDHDVDIPWEEMVAAFFGGLLTAAVLIMLATFAFMRTSDVYGLGHWKLNVKMPLATICAIFDPDVPRTTPDGKPVQVFEEACASLLRELLITAGLLGDQSRGRDNARQAFGVLDLGFGCGEQTWELTRLLDLGSWADFRYVGLSLNQAQVQAASRKIYQEVSRTDQLKAESFSLFCANAATPGSWNPQTEAAVGCLADEKFTERWLLALDCLYHFKPSRKPVLEHAARKLDANFMAFDLILNEKASFWDTWKLRAIGIMMGCPTYTFLTEDQYREQLVECGYDRRCTEVRDISAHVFPGVVAFINDQERALGQYGISMGGYKLAGRLFEWFGKSKAVKASLIVARTKGKSN